MIVKRRNERAAWMVRERESRGWSIEVLTGRLAAAGYPGRDGPLKPATVRGWEAPSRNGPPPLAIDYLERIFDSTAPTSSSEDIVLERIALALEQLPVRLAIMQRAIADFPLDDLPALLETDVAQILETVRQRSSPPSPARQQGPGS